MNPEGYFARYSSCPSCGGSKGRWQEYCYSCQSATTSASIASKKAKPNLSIGEQIYAVSVAGMESAPIKIGFTTDLATRLTMLQTGSPLPLEVVAVDQGTRGNERFLHRALKSYRTHGEWFTRSDLVMSLVGAMKQGRLAEWVRLAKSNHP